MLETQVKELDTSTRTHKLFSDAHIRELQGYEKLAAENAEEFYHDVVNASLAYTEGLIAQINEAVAVNNYEKANDLLYEMSTIAIQMSLASLYAQ